MLLVLALRNGQSGFRLVFLGLGLLEADQNVILFQGNKKGPLFIALTFTVVNRINDSRYFKTQLKLHAALDIAQRVKRILIVESRNLESFNGKQILFLLLGRLFFLSLFFFLLPGGRQYKHVLKDKITQGDGNAPNHNGFDRNFRKEGKLYFFKRPRIADCRPFHLPAKKSQRLEKQLEIYFADFFKKIVKLALFFPAAPVRR